MCGKKQKTKRNHTIFGTAPFCFLDAAHVSSGPVPIVFSFWKTLKPLVTECETKKIHFKNTLLGAFGTCAKSPRFLGGRLFLSRFWDKIIQPWYHTTEIRLVDDISSDEFERQRLILHQMVYPNTWHTAKVNGKTRKRFYQVRYDCHELRGEYLPNPET